MKSMFLLITAIGLLLMPLAVSAQSEQNSRETPPISQPMIREGDLALKLVDVLKIGATQEEGEAETMLTSSGIAPRNGWIADYPVTPDIIGELQNAIGEAADSGRLALGRDEATKALQNLTVELGLPIPADSSGQYAGTEPPKGYGEYSDPSVINDYYDSEGPPVVTYYPPPWDYDYMYAWIPSPFWYSGFYFPGFFILHDFHRVIFVHNKRCVVSNHFFDHKTRKFSTIDPARRFARDGFRKEGDLSRGRRFDSREARRGAESIFQRSRERAATASRGRAGSGSDFVSPKTGGRPEGERFTNKRDQGRTFNGGSAGSERLRNNSERRNGMTLRGPTNSPSVSNRGGSRNFGTYERSGRTFSAPSLGSKGSSGSIGSGRSFGGFSAGSHSSGSRGGFARGGFSGGGGCRGRC